MLEIFTLIWLTRRVGEIVGAKGRKPGWYKFMTVVLWFGCEVGGAIIGGIIVALSGSEAAWLAYLFALVGAACGAGAAILIAKAVPPVAVMPMAPPPPPTFR